MASIPVSGIVSALPIGLEIGPKRRVFAQVIEWPGWCRSGRDEAAALAAVESVMDRYRAAVGDLAGPLGSGDPAFTIMERVEGGTTTDFGALDRVLASDRRALEPGEPERLAAFLDACWATFDRAFAAIPAGSREVKPPVGRAADTMRNHVVESGWLHLSWLVRPVPKPESADLAQVDAHQRRLLRAAVLELPLGVPFESERHPGPWVVRRECWHVLDHAWELEDRSGPA